MAGVGLLALFILLYFTASIEIARKSALQVDEVFVMWIVRYFPGWRVMDALKMGLDSLPPLYYWLAQACTLVLGQTPLAIRLPAILGFFLFPASVFWLLWKRVDWRIACAAMFFTTGTAAAWAATMGRPYGIVVGGFSVAAAAWVDLPQSRHRTLRCLLIAGGLAAGIAVHFLAVYEVAALCLAELLRSRRLRRVQWDCGLALATGFVTLLLWLPLIAPLYRSTHVSVHSPGFYAQPTLAKFFYFFRDILIGSATEQIEIILLLMIVPLVLARLHIPGRRREVRHQEDGRWQDVDIIVAASFAIPLIAFVASAWVGAFNERYFIASVFGVTLLVARGLDALPHGATTSWVISIVAALHLLSMGGVHPPTDSRVTMVERAPQDLPVLIASGSDFFFLSEALPPDRVKQIAFAGMPAAAPSPDTEPEIIAGRWKAAVPSMPIYSWHRWIQLHRKFYVLSSSDPREGFTDWLAVHENPALILHDGQCWLFKVSLDDEGSELSNAHPPM